MKLSIKNTIYQSIIQNKWIDISYVNKKEESTDYYIGIKDIDINKGIIVCDIFNPYKSNSVLNTSSKDIYIYINGIKSASILEQSYYETPTELLNKVISDKRVADFLDVVNFDNNILCYLSDCYRLGGWY